MAGAVTDRLSEHGLTRGSDGLTRCAWSSGSDDYRVYHDREWGHSVLGDVPLYERITLEAFQSGLSWITVLRKRPAFRAAFCDFDPVQVAKFGDRDVERLICDAGIIRNRRKIEATLTNARALLSLWDKNGSQSLTSLVWAHAPSYHARPIRAGDIPTQTTESEALAKSLKRQGFTFIGPTTMYAAMQACGLVDDHLEGCYVGDAGCNGGGG